MAIHSTILFRNSTWLGKLPGAILLLVLTYCPPSTTSGQESTYNALLLKDTDRVIVGRIAQRGDFYEVELAVDSKISIPTGKVAALGKSVEELYHTKRRSISQWSVGDHYQLTRWCLVNNLLSQATEHYAETAKRAPDHARVKQLAVELADRLARDVEFREFMGLPPLASAPPPSVAPYGANASAAAAVVTASAYDSSVAKHPEIARRFIERVQPILMNRCSQSACHGAHSANKLRLLEPYSKTNARTSTENLASVLGQISHRQNELSPLVHFATQPHGTQKAPAIAVTESQLLAELHNWIEFARNPVVSAVVSDQPWMQQPVRTAEQTRLQPYENAVALVPVQPGTSQLRQVPLSPNTDGKIPVGTQVPPQIPLGTFPLGTQPPTTPELDALEKQLKQDLGELPSTAGSPSSGQSSVTTDPFDPAEFNRKSQQGTEIR